MEIRAATGDDIPAIAAMYGYHVLHGLGTFEEEPPSVAEMGGRLAAVRAAGLPYLVATLEGRVVGFAYAAPFRPRAAYRHTVEDSVYIAPETVGRGVGRALLGAVIDACERLGKRQMVAVIGDSGNAASVGLHAALGFKAKGRRTVARLQARAVGGHRLDAAGVERRRRERAGSVTESGVFRLDGGGDTLVFLTRFAGAPRLVYWGPALPKTRISRASNDWTRGPYRRAASMTARP